MEVAVIGRSQSKLGRPDLVVSKEPGLGLFSNHLSPPKLLSRKSNVFFPRKISWPVPPSSCSSLVRFSLKAVAQSQANVASDAPTARGRSDSKPNDGVRLYVGLPLDSVSDCNAINHARAIAAGLKALKLLGVDGVELPVWWGVAEKDAMGKYEWSGYLALAEMVQKVGLKLHVSLCFHASEEPKIPLPKWVSQIGESQPDIFFADRSGQKYKDCLALAVDDLPVLGGKTPIQAYKNFCESFKSTFSPFMGSTITGISIGLGPDGELRYPSHHHFAKSQNIFGVGEFQCYDKNMLSHLKEHAQTLGNPLWGLAGPHDVPRYNESPYSNNFFKENAGSWETPYGDFFLSWYSSQLVSHGDRLLSLAASTFSDTPVTIAGKVPLIHSWYRTRSHASELTAGFYNTASKDGYEAIAEIFGRNSCKMILPGMDLADENQPHGALSSPELLLSQITTACEKHGVKIAGQNSPVPEASKGFEQIKKNIAGKNAVMELFTYQRMGASLFSPENFPSFTEFVRSLNQPELHSDDLAEYEELTVESSRSESSKDLQMQAA